MSESASSVSSDSDAAPKLYLPDGTPVKVRMVGRECEGDVSGEGHYAYRQASARDEEPTVFFEPVGYPDCPHGCREMVPPTHGDPLEPAEPYCPECGHINGNGCDDGCYHGEPDTPPRFPRVAAALRRIRCRLFGHPEDSLVKVVLGVGRRREFYRCERCSETVHNPQGGTDDE